MDDPHITRPLVKLDEPVVGFYALSGERVLQFLITQEKEQICACLKGIREQNPGQRILLVLDNFSSHACEHYGLPINLVSTSYFFQLAHPISTRSSRSGRASNGKHGR